MKNLPPNILIDEKLCIGCLQSIKACPTKAIRMKEGRHYFVEGRCIGCGECIRVCPTGAIKAATSGMNDLSKDEIPVALVSPVLYSQFPGVMPEEILQGLRHVGFKHAVDMSYFLEMFQCAAEELIIRNRKNKRFPFPLISPICPVVIRLIAAQFPDLLEHILPIMRPVALMVREVKQMLTEKYGGKDGAVVLYYINPCPTKMDVSAHRKGYEIFYHEMPFVDKVLGINDLFGDLSRYLENIRYAPSENLISQDIFNYHPEASSLMWGLSGGEIMDMDIERSLAVSGLRDTIAYLEKIEMGLFSDIEYIEFRTCPEGCVGGTLTGIEKFIAKNIIRKTVPYQKKKRISRDMIRKRYDKGNFQAKSRISKLAKRYGVYKEPLSIESLKEIQRIIELIGGMNCAACGAPDCRTFAEEVVRGYADISDCIVLQARKLTQKQEKHDC